MNQQATGNFIALKRREKNLTQEQLAEKIGVKHYIVEQDANFANGNPFDSIKASSDYLKKYIK